MELIFQMRMTVNKHEMCLVVNKCHGKNENGMGQGLTGGPTLGWGGRSRNVMLVLKKIPCRKSQGKAFQAK